MQPGQPSQPHTQSVLNGITDDLKRQLKRYDEISATIRNFNNLLVDTGTENEENKPPGIDYPAGHIGELKRCINIFAEINQRMESDVDKFRNII